MAHWIGALGSIGMLALIGGLIVAFLREIGLLSAQGRRLIVKIAVLTGAVGGAYILLGALIRQVLHGDVDSAAFFHQIFTGDYLRACFAALEGPGWPGLLSGLFAFAAHGLGTVLFHQYFLAGAVLCYLLTAASALMLHSVLKGIFGDERRAADVLFLFFCLPGSVFFFLPCGAAVGLLMAAACLFFVRKRLPRCRFAWSQEIYGWLLAVCGMLSALTVYGLVDGRIG